MSCRISYSGLRRIPDRRRLITPDGLTLGRSSLSSFSPTTCRASACLILRRLPLLMTPRLQGPNLILEAILPPPRPLLEPMPARGLPNGTSQTLAMLQDGMGLIKNPAESMCYAGPDCRDGDDTTVLGTCIPETCEGSCTHPPASDCLSVCSVDTQPMCMWSPAIDADDALLDGELESTSTFRHERCVPDVDAGRCLSRGRRHHDRIAQRQKNWYCPCLFYGRLLCMFSNPPCVWCFWHRGRIAAELPTKPTWDSPVPCWSVGIYPCGRRCSSLQRCCRRRECSGPQGPPHGDAC